MTQSHGRLPCTHLHNKFSHCSITVSIAILPIDVSLQDVDLHSFVRIVCSVLDIPVYDNPIESLHVLFTLLLEFKNNPAFKSTQMGGLSLAEQKLFQAGSRSESQAGLRSPRATVSAGRQSADFLSLS